MSIPDELLRGREFYRRHEWLNSYESLSRVDALKPLGVDVLRLIVAGKTNKVIAQEMFLSERTIDRHVSNILNKLDIPSRSAATAYAHRNNLV